MYKLIAVDMDGTLLRKDDTISKRNKEVIRKVREKGIKVVIASGRPIHEVNFKEIPIDEEIIKIMYVGEPKEIDRVMKALPEVLYEDYNIVRSMPFYLEFLSKTSGKKTGIEILAKRLDVAPQEVMCIGDAGNDIEMLQYAGMGIAMGNAFKEVKEIADYITKTNEEDGVAHAIEKFVDVS